MLITTLRALITYIIASSLPRSTVSPFLVARTEFDVTVGYVCCGSAARCLAFLFFVLLSFTAVASLPSTCVASLQSITWTIASFWTLFVALCVTYPQVGSTLGGSMSTFRAISFTFSFYIAFYLFSLSLLFSLPYSIFSSLFDVLIQLSLYCFVWTCCLWLACRSLMQECISLQEACMEEVNHLRELVRTAHTCFIMNYDEHDRRHKYPACSLWLYTIKNCVLFSLEMFCLFACCYE